LIVLGPEAKTLVWVVRDGEVLHVDCNANSDLSDDGAAIKPKSKYRDGRMIFEVSKLSYADGKKDGTLEVDVFPDGATSVAFKTKYPQQTAAFRFADKPGKAPVVHFDGPLGIRVVGPPAQHDRLIQAFEVMIGTPGLSEETFAYIPSSAVPKKLSPVLEAEFPGTDKGEAPITVKVDLYVRPICGMKCFRGSVRTPTEAAAGNVKIRVTFPGWREGKVFPLELSVPLK
jgi:hypothetical protein